MTDTLSPSIAEVQPAHIDYTHGRFPLVGSPDIFWPDGYKLDEVLVTDHRRILPPPSFSRAAFLKLEELANQPRLDVPIEASLFAVYLLGREDFTFDEEMGCWTLYLRAEYDEKGRARYPNTSSRALGTQKGTLAHRASVRFFQGKSKAEIRGMPVDHLCRNHACCNPYHLEAVTPEENARRGVADRREQLNLSHLHPGVVAVRDFFAKYSKVASAFTTC